MTISKTYLNVPYAEKDVAKSLGAKWDASKKKWYAPAKLDLSLFDKWQSELTTSNKSTTGKTKSSSSAKKSPLGAITQPKDKNFIAYNADLPPWD